MKSTGVANRVMSDAHWLQSHPLISHLKTLRPTAWFNPAIAPVAEALADVGLGQADIDVASQRLHRFAPYIAQVFPETAEAGGLIESPVVLLTRLQTALQAQAQAQPKARAEKEVGAGAAQTVSSAAVPLKVVLASAQEAAPEGQGASASGLPWGRLWLKADNSLPIAGSIKARGGIHEVLKHAEDLALTAGLIRPGDDYASLDSEAARAFFSQHRIAVGSTGNLGLSIGIMSAKLGFQVSVHMSADAQPWKKALLRAHGVTVVEHASDYGAAVAAGRVQAEADPHTYFVDDENSPHLFLGYAVAAERLARQFKDQGVIVGAEHPLFVYLPCGVGGGPGGVAFGLKCVFGDAVHCVFAEPTHSPCMLLGVYTGLHEGISVADIGLDNRTAADGLAVARPSGFVGRAMQRLIDGYVTVSDETLFRDLKQMFELEGIRLEPSALAGLSGVLPVLSDADYHRRIGLTPERAQRATHLVWATGGRMVPDEVFQSYLQRK
ncbi:MAG: D-serine ammonia-lyase [Lautropia sp.]|nr:D-serine ammonia-lyase [Lautropia sp.]